MLRTRQEFRLRLPNTRVAEHEEFRLSVLDLVVPPNYNTYAIIFKKCTASEDAIIETFKRGIEATIQQCRHLVGTIQANRHGDYSIIRTPESDVLFVAQSLHGTGNDFVSYLELEKAHFTCAKMGDLDQISIKEIPSSCHPDERPPVVAFKLNFISGGFIFTTHMHHFAVDMTGTASVIRQIADNCKSIVHGTMKPSWDETYTDRSRFFAPSVNVEDRIEPPPRPLRHPAWNRCSWLLFHLSPGKAAQLKYLCAPIDGSRISTYDAVIATLWRVVLRNRAMIYNSDLSAVAIFGEPINMRNRCSPKISSRYQGNMLAAGLSMTQQNPLTLADVISRVSLSDLALFVRKVTDSVGQHTLDETVAKIAPLTDKGTLDMPLDSLSPMSFTTTDWRSAKLCDNDFGVGQPMAYRCLYHSVVENMVILYPPHKAGDQRQGIEVMVPFESHATDKLLGDPTMSEYFEFRGLEIVG